MIDLEFIVVTSIYVVTKRYVLATIMEQIYRVPVLFLELPCRQRTLLV